MKKLLMLGTSKASCEMIEYARVKAYIQLLLIT